MEWLFVLCCFWVGGLVSPGSLGAASWTNSASIAIVDNAPGAPYPSTINVSGLTGNITKLTVTLVGMSHSYPDDIDILLVGPTGQKTILMSDAGGSLPLGAVNLTFDDAAVLSLPDAAQISSGTFKPSNYEAAVDAFASPAPAGPYNAALAPFLGTAPNGTWSLYVVDDAARDQGTIVNGWYLTISTVVNGQPTISTIPNQTILEDGVAGPIGFTVGDAETPAGNLVVTAVSSDNNLVPASNIVVGGSGANRTLTLTPAANQFGSATITVSVNDSIDTVSTNFNLTVTAVNDPPTINPIPNQTTARSTPTSPIPVIIGDLESSASSLTLSGTSSNPGVVPNSGITFGGSGTNRTVTLTPVTGVVGGTTISITVTDPNSATAVAQFALSVSDSQSFNNSSSIVINDKNSATPYPSVINVSGVSGTLRTVKVRLNGLSHSYPDDIDILLVSPTGKSVLVMSDAGGSGGLSNATLIFDDAATDLLPDASPITPGTFKPTDYDSASDLFPSPAPAAPWGTTFASLAGSQPNGAWSLYVVDDAATDLGSISGGWSLTVVSDSNTAPIISAIPNQTIPQNGSSGAIPFTISDGETLANLLNLTVTSSNSDLLPTNNIVVTGTSTNRTITFTPVAGVYGTSTVVLKVADESGASSTATVLVTVTRAAGATVTIASTSWSLEVDGNNNGYFESSRLSWNPDVIGGGSKQVFEKLYWRTNDGPWIFFAATAPHTITGTSTADLQSVDIVEDANKVNSMLVDYKVELYLNGQSTADDTHIPANDSKLGLHKEEGIPDLTVFAAATQPQLATVVYQPSDCAVSHGCAQAGARRLLQFAMQTRNMGKTDLFLGSPVNNPLFVFDPCHGHYHFQGFATYRLLAGTSLVAAGNKVGFCLEDVARFDSSAPAAPKYDCLNQGIQAGWYDNYGLQLTCQWIDITGVPPGNYNLEITANPFAQLKESNYTNNSTLISITVTNTAPTISGISDQTLLSNTSTVPIPFTVWDGETDWNALTVTAQSSNPGLIPLSGIVFGGSGSSRTVKITPASNQSGSSLIKLIVADTNGGTATNSFTVVVGNNNPPVITLSGSTINYTENDAPTVIDPGATVTDPDNSQFSGGNLTVDIFDLGQPEDRLGIRNQGTAAGQIGVNGANVTFGGAVIGTFTGGTNGSSPLVITFTTTSATVLAVQSLVTNVTYFDVSENPSASPRTIRYVVNDGNGGFSSAVTKVVQVIPVNDPPILTLSGSSTVYSPSAAATILDGTALVSDVDSADFQLGHLKVTIIDNPSVDDRLTISTNGQVAVFANGVVSYGGITMGDISGGTDGSTPLLIDFDVIPSPVTVAVAQDLARSIQFYNVSASPSTLQRTLRFEITDGDGGTALATNTVIFSSTPVNPVITWSNPPDIIYGTPLGVSQLNATANVPGTFNYSPGPGTVLNAGAGQILSVIFTPSNLASYNIVTNTVAINVQKAVPSITWSNPADIVYGTLLGAGQLNATTGVPGIFTYVPAGGTLLHAGIAQSLSVTFTPADTANLLPANASVSINVSKAPLTATAPTLNKNYGAALPTLTVGYSGFVNNESASVLDTVPTVTTTATATSPVGGYPTQASGGVDGDYSFSYVNGQLNVVAVPLTITADNKSRIVGTPNPTLTLSYAGLVNGDTPASLTTQPTASTTATSASAIGTYPITVTGAASSNYQITQVAGTLTITSPTILPLTSTWRYTSDNLDATPTWKTSAYNDSAWASGAGLLALEDNSLVQPINTVLPSVQPTYYFRTHFNFSSSITPSDRVVFTNFIDDGAVFYLNGNEIARVRLPASPTPVTYDTVTTGTPPGGDATSPDVFFITGSDLNFLVQGDNVLAVEVHQVSTATSDVVFGSELTLVPLNTPVITWSNPADIVYGTALSALQLNALSDVPGTFVYTPDIGAVLNAGTQVLNTTFTPTDTVNYRSVTATVNLQVLKATPGITWSNPADIVYGTPLSGTQLNANASVAGSFAYTPDVGAILNAGLRSLGVTFTPTDLVNYQTATASVNLQVQKALPVITWSNPADVTYGTLLSATQLNASTPVAGVLTYNPVVGTLLHAGSGQSLGVTFTPTDTGNYLPASAGVTLNVSKAVLQATAVGANKLYGAALPTLTVSLTGFVNGENPSVIDTLPTATTTATASSGVGTYPITASGGADGDYSFNYVPGTLVIGQAPLTITAQDKSRPQGVANPVLTVSYVGLTNGDTSASLSPGPTVTTTATQSSPQGSYPITASGAVNPNYAITYVAGTLTVTAPTLVSIAVTPSTPSIQAGSTQQFTAQGTFTDGSVQNLTSTATWQSGNGTVASINSSGLATGLAGGTSLITASSSSVLGSATLTVTAASATQGSFTNATAIVVPSVGAASPYPSTVNVSGLSGLVTKVTVSLNGIYHTYPDDLDILLVGPEGQKVLLMSDAGGNPDLVNVRLTFDDAASGVLPDSTLIAAGSYKPTNYESAADTFTAPAPAGPYGSLLSDFIGSAPNGTWSLYVLDDAASDQGVITNGWTLNLTTATAAPPPPSFTNSVAITIPSIGASTPYPSTLVVSGLSGTVGSVVVRVNGINHTYPDDIDMLLVGPTGQTVLLMSDAGGGPDLVGVNLTFDDTATATLPDATQISSGKFKPTNYESTVDAFPAPAPVGPYGATLASFAGTNPNGTWSLYVVDDASVDQGSITGGWSLSITMVAPPPPPLQAAPLLVVAFQSVTRLTNGDVQMVLQGNPGQSYVIEASTDLTTWVEIGAGTFAKDVIEFVDASPDKPTMRFYRARVSE